MSLSSEELEAIKELFKKTNERIDEIDIKINTIADEPSAKGKKELETEGNPYVEEYHGEESPANEIKGDKSNEILSWLDKPLWGKK